MSTRRKGNRGTRVAQRKGIPAVMTTTTDEHVFADDETRFLSCHIDISRKQNLAILRARAKRAKHIDENELQLWRAAISALKFGRHDFRHPPKWLDYVARHVPLDDVRVRRDWDRFLTFCCAIALCRSFRSKHD